MKTEIDQACLQPLRIDLGCGTSKPYGFVGVDVSPGSGVDIVADLSKRFPFEDNSVDEVRAHDVIEHLQDRIHTMNEIWRICKPGAKVDIRVPSTDGRGAFQDPTHISFWNINSFLYYCSEFPAYLELCRRYGFKGEFKVVHLEHEESPRRVIHVIAELSVVKPISDLTNNQITENAHLITEEYQQNINKQVASEINVVSQGTERFLQISFYSQQYQQDSTSGTAITNLCQLRSQIAHELLNLADSEIEIAYTGKLGREYNLLLTSGIKQQKLSTTEQAFIDELVESISKGVDAPQAIQSLLVAMLYIHPQQLPRPQEITHIPHWLLNEYVTYLFNSPSYFKKVGDADHYYRYIKSWMDYLHSAMLKGDNSLQYSNFLESFVKNANFIPVYFNEVNLKDIYVKRAEVLEYFLKLNNCEIDYEFPEKTVGRNKIRLGILAAHFLPSAETFASLPVYEYLSREFEVILYFLSQAGHPLEHYCQLSGNAFRLLPQELSEQVNTIRADDIDILFIASNVTAVTNQILLLVTHRLARIQITSVSSVVTTGVRNIDYYISSTLADPSSRAQEHYQEKLVQLEGTAHCFSYGIEEEKLTLPVERKNLGIPDDAIVFISGANYFKTVPELIETWAKIITKVPSSVLVLLPFGPNWSNNYPKLPFIAHLKSIFGKYKLAYERLIVLDPQPAPDRGGMKEYYKIADVYLDSFPFAGTTSLIEPLQVNLPVIARQGNYFRSAMGAAMIQTLNIPGLVADSEESYIRLAVTLGNSSELRQQKSHQIQERMQNNPSFLDSRSYSAKMGSLFQELLRNYFVNNLAKKLCLRDINLIVFPDWTQPEDEIGFELQEVIKAIATLPNNHYITLIVDTSNIADEDADAILSSIVMNLLMKEDLDITEGAEISLLGKLNKLQWQALRSRIQARVVLENENAQAIANSGVINIPIFEQYPAINRV